MEIYSKQDFVMRENSRGQSTQSAQVIISQTVKHNLKDVEIVDTFYSSKDGYWCYVRISKAEWDYLIAEEMRRIEERVLLILEPTLNNEGLSIAFMLANLLKT